MAYQYYNFKNRKYTKSDCCISSNQEYKAKSRKSSEHSLKMVKNSHHRPNTDRNDILQKSTHKSSIASTGDQESISAKSKLSSNKTPVYVHQFKTKSSRNATPRTVDTSNVYTHGFQDYYTEKAKFFKNKFDSLSLVSKNYQNSPGSYQETPQSRQSAKRNKNEFQLHAKSESIHEKSKAKFKSAHPIDEAVINQLEESYWANWKPNNKTKPIVQPKQTPAKVVRSEKTYIKKIPTIPSVLAQAIARPPKTPKTPKIETTTSVVKVEEKHVVLPAKPERERKPEKKLEFIHKPVNIAESKSSEIELNVVSVSSTFAEQSSSNTKESVESICSKIKLITPMELQEPKLEPKVEELVTLLPTVLPPSVSSNVSFKKDLRVLEPSLSKTVQPHLASSVASSSDHEEVRMIKHTDSFIITAKKQNAEKQHHPQPKCIKLQKNPNVINRSHYIKGGSYPLKSCLKKEKISSQSLVLGKPGSPMLLQPNKNKKTRKSK